LFNFQLVILPLGRQRSTVVLPVFAVLSLDSDFWPVPLVRSVHAPTHVVLVVLFDIHVCDNDDDGGDGDEVMDEGEMMMMMMMMRDLM